VLLLPDGDSETPGYVRTFALTMLMEGPDSGFAAALSGTSFLSSASLRGGPSFSNTHLPGCRPPRLPLFNLKTQTNDENTLPTRVEKIALSQMREYDPQNLPLGSVIIFPTKRPRASRHSGQTLP